MPTAVHQTFLAAPKVNLTLRVLGRRADGYHELDSLVAFAQGHTEMVGDILTFVPGPAASVHVTGPFAGAISGENLALSAMRLVAERMPEATLGCVTIDKHLPVAAGLGGGSADAAFALHLVRLANPALAARPDWAEIALALGSDVPVCYRSQRGRIRGRGEIFVRLKRMPRFSAVLINPQVPVPADKTAKVFRQLRAPPFVPERTAAFTEPRYPHDWLDAICLSSNDLEAPATAIMPAIAEVLAAARADPRTRLARLSGAGPTCFILPAEKEAAVGLAADLAARHPNWWVRSVYLR